MLRRIPWIRSILAAVVALALAGCGGDDEIDTGEPAAEYDAGADPSAATAATEPEQSTTDVLQGNADGVPQVDIRASIRAADAALQRNDLVSATDALLKVQVSGALKNSPEAAVDHYQRMVELQRRVADAMVSGDPNAERAAALLRQAHGAY